MISSRAKGLSVGVNINPTRHCTFNCLYCEVDHSQPPLGTHCDLDALSSELERTLQFVWSDEIRNHAFFGKLPLELTELRHVAISGDGEPTLCKDFTDAVHALMHVRARSPEFFKIVLITNGSGLHLPEIQTGLQYFTQNDEVWVKLDAGTAEFAQKINRSQIPYEKVLSNILEIARRRPITVQSLFVAVNDEGPPREEIEQYAQRLAELKQAGAQIRLVQVYSVDRPSQECGCSHLPLKTLSSIAATVRRVSGLRAEVF